MTNDGGTIRVYVDGALQGSPVSQGPNDFVQQALQISGYPGGPTTNYNIDGLVDDAAIWNEGLQGWQIAGLADGSWSPLNVPIPEPSTLATWALGLACLGFYGWRKRRCR